MFCQKERGDAKMIIVTYSAMADGISFVIESDVLILNTKYWELDEDVTNASKELVTV
jgi:hypothetical protein